MLYSYTASGESTTEIARYLNRARVDPYLSGYEGAMFASIEYAPHGANSGFEDRDMFFDGGCAEIVDDTLLSKQNYKLPSPHHVLSYR